jgi:hypothetical protein
MRRSSQLVGLDFSTGRSISPLPVFASLANARLIFMTFRERVRGAPLASLGIGVQLKTKNNGAYGLHFESMNSPISLRSPFASSINDVEMM